MKTKLTTLAVIASALALSACITTGPTSKADTGNIYYACLMLNSGAGEQEAAKRCEDEGSNYIRAIARESGVPSKSLSKNASLYSKELKKRAKANIEAMQ